MVLTTIVPTGELKPSPKTGVQSTAKSATSLRINQACSDVAQFRIPTYAQPGGVLSNKSYWRGLTSYGFAERGMFMAKWAIPVVVMVIWAAPRPFLWQKIDQVLNGTEQE